MPICSPCCTRSAPSRLEWRPSRLQHGAQALVLLAAPWLLAASALPAAWRVPVLGLLWTLGPLLIWRGLRQPRRVLHLPPPPAPLLLQGQALQAPRLQARGPWLQLSWGPRWRRQRLLFWPDTLDRAQRRELRLAVSARAVPQAPRSMAP